MNIYICLYVIEFLFTSKHHTIKIKRNFENFTNAKFTGFFSIENFKYINPSKKEIIPIRKLIISIRKLKTKVFRSKHFDFVVKNCIRY